MPLDSTADEWHSHIVDRDELVHRLDYLRAGQRLGFTSGAFDLLHAGHVAFLEAARAACDLLVVGINSDRSVNWLKGHHRPVMPQDDRARLVAALRCVDRVFLFDETTNHVNISQLKPDVYFKGSDYQHKPLSSAPLVLAYGGRVELLETPQTTTTSIIARVLETQRITAAPNHPAPRPIVFLDRDGTLIENDNYVHRPDQVRLRPGVCPNLARLQSAGCRLVVVTNQGGIALGYYPQEDFFATSTRLMQLLTPVTLDRVYFCPHGINDGCACRKPKPGMLLRGLQELNGTPQTAWMIGDKPTDIEAGRAAGVASFQVGTADELTQAVDQILAALS